LNRLYWLVSSVWPELLAETQAPSPSFSVRLEALVVFCVSRFNLPPAWMSRLCALASMALSVMSPPLLSWMSLAVSVVRARLVSWLSAFRLEWLRPSFHASFVEAEVWFSPADSSSLLPALSVSFSPAVRVAATPVRSRPAPMLTLPAPLTRVPV